MRKNRRSGGQKIRPGRLNRSAPSRAMYGRRAGVSRCSRISPQQRSRNRRAPLRAAQLPGRIGRTVFARIHGESRLRPQPDGGLLLQSDPSLCDFLGRGENQLLADQRIHVAPPGTESADAGACKDCSVRLKSDGDAVECCGSGGIPDHGCCGPARSVAPSGPLPS